MHNKFLKVCWKKNIACKSFDKSSFIECLLIANEWVFFERVNTLFLIAFDCRQRSYFMSNFCHIIVINLTCYREIPILVVRLTNGKYQIKRQFSGKYTFINIIFFTWYLCNVGKPEAFIKIKYEFTKYFCYTLLFFQKSPTFV